MNNLLHAFAEYPVLIGIAVFLVISLLLAVFLIVLMRRVGVSLKPLVFFFGFLAITAAPQRIRVERATTAAARHATRAGGIVAQPLACAEPARRARASHRVAQQRHTRNHLALRRRAMVGPHART